MKKRAWRNFFLDLFYVLILVGLLFCLGFAFESDPAFIGLSGSDLVADPAFRYSVYGFTGAMVLLQICIVVVRSVWCLIRSLRKSSAAPSEEVQP